MHIIPFFPNMYENMLYPNELNIICKYASDFGQNSFGKKWKELFNNFFPTGQTHGYS